MVKGTYISVLNDIEGKKLPALDSAWLEDMINNYPCFHGAHLLKGIYLKKDGEELFEEGLPHIALRVNNRAVLYDRVHENYGTIKKVVSKGEKEIPVEVKPAVHERQISTEGSEDLKSLVEAIRTKRKEQPIKSKVERKAKNIESAVNKNVSKPKVSKKPPVKKVVSPLKKKKVLVKEKPTGSFVDWLKHQKPVDKVKANEKAKIPIDLTASNEAELILEAKRSSFKLEDFLVNQIQRKQDRKEGFSSGIHHAVSETYAKILADQGKIQEAIAIYKELSIKYPKKSSSFARQIEKLKSN